MSAEENPGEIVDAKFSEKEEYKPGDDIRIKEIEELSFEGKNAKDAQEMWLSVMREYVFNRTDISNHDKVALMKEAADKMTEEQKKDFNVLANADALDPESEGKEWGLWPPIAWPKRMGLAKGQREISRTNPVPLKLDRIGSLGGTNFGVMPEDGHIYSQDERAIAYLENPNAYHQYEFDNKHYFDYIDIISDETQSDRKKLNEMIAKNNPPGIEISELEFKHMRESIQHFLDKQKEEDMGTESKYGLIGTAAEWEVNGVHIAKGGADQLNTPISGEMLMKMGVLKEI